MNKDVLTCPVTEILTAKPEATYFEGQKVFAACSSDEGVYEAYYNVKSPCQNEASSEPASLYVQDEDCLYLNVWRADDGGTKKPVMVWIHGSAYEMGGTADRMYELHNFVKENSDVVAVSIAYRVADMLTLRVFPERDGKYLPLDPYAAYADGTAKDIDIMQGCNKNELNYFAYFMGVEAFKKWDIDRKANYFKHMTDEEKALVDSFCDDIRGEDYEYSSRMFDFIAPLFRTSEIQTMGGGKSYTYYFTPEASLPIMRCGHAVELASVLSNPQETVFTGRAFDETFSKVMREILVHFSKTGNPSLSAEISPDGKAHDWPLYETQSFSSLHPNGIKFCRG